MIHLYIRVSLLIICNKLFPHCKHIKQFHIYNLEWWGVSAVFLQRHVNTYNWNHSDLVNLRQIFQVVWFVRKNRLLSTTLGASPKLLLMMIITFWHYLPLIVRLVSKCSGHTDWKTVICCFRETNFIGLAQLRVVSPPVSNLCLTVCIC